MLIENLLDKVDELIIGGGMAYTFSKTLDGMAVSILTSPAPIGLLEWR